MLFRPLNFPFRVLATMKVTASSDLWQKTLLMAIEHDDFGVRERALGRMVKVGGTHISPF